MNQFIGFIIVYILWYGVIAYLMQPFSNVLSDDQVTSICTLGSLGFTLISRIDYYTTEGHK